MPGDRLWIRETWHATFADSHDPSKGHRSYHDTPKDQRVAHITRTIDYFEAEMRKESAHRIAPIRWVSSIHINRWASRLMLVIKKLRFCRLQDITDAEAIAGGGGEEEVIDPRSRRRAITSPNSRMQPKKFRQH
jgi:hypothetical protein